MSVPVVAGQNPINFETVSEATRNTLPRDLVNIIVIYAHPHFQEIAATATAWLTGKVPLNGNLFRGTLVQLSVPFGAWLGSDEREKTLTQLQLVEDLFERVAKPDNQLVPAGQFASKAIAHLKALPATSPAALAFHLRGMLHQFFVTRQAITAYHADAQTRIEIGGAFKLLSPSMQAYFAMEGEADPEVLTPDIEAAIIGGETAEIASLFLKIGGVVSKIGGDDSREDEFSCLRQEARQAALTAPMARQHAVLKALFTLLERLHMIHFMQKCFQAGTLADKSRSDIEDQTHEEMAKLDPFLRTHCPELGMLRTILSKMSDRGPPVSEFAEIEETIERAESECQPYERFMVYLEERELGYAFLHDTHEALVASLNTSEEEGYRKLLEQNKQPPLLTPAQFNAIKTQVRRSDSQLRLERQEIIKSYAIEPIKLSAAQVEASFAPSLKGKQKVAPKAKKKAVDPFARYATDSKNEKVAETSTSTATAAAGGSAGAPALAAPESVAPQAALEAIFGKRTVNLSAIKFAPRVQQRLDAPKARGKTREDVWAHGFTTQLDEFLGTSYCYSVEKPHPKTGRKETHHCFIVMVEDEEAPNNASTGRPASVPYVATYTVDEKGVCYHRSLQKKSLFDLFNAVAKQQMHDLVEWPPLKQAAAEKSKLRVGEPNNRPMQLNAVSGIVTVFDKKHNVTFKVLPRNQTEKRGLK